MFYILASNYNSKLYHHVASRGLSVQLVQSLDQLLLSEDDTVILDVHNQDIERILSSPGKSFRYILMGDENRIQGNIQFVSKYQPIESICSTFFDRQNQIVTLIGEETLFNKIMMDQPNCNFLDFSYMPDSDLTLIQILDKCEEELLNSFGSSSSKIMYPITSVMDLLDPPINLIRPLMETLKKSRDTIVRIDHLKGPLDLMLLNLSELIIIVHEKIGSTNKKLDNSIETIMSTKKIISLHVSTKAYEHFKLSDHMLYVKEP